MLLLFSLPPSPLSLPTLCFSLYVFGLVKAGKRVCLATPFGRQLIDLPFCLDGPRNGFSYRTGYEVPHTYTHTDTERKTYVNLCPFYAALIWKVLKSLLAPQRFCTSLISPFIQWYLIYFKTCFCFQFYFCFYSSLFLFVLSPNLRASFHWNIRSNIYALYTLLFYFILFAFSKFHKIV